MKNCLDYFFIVVGVVVVVNAWVFDYKFQDTYIQQDMRISNLEGAVFIKKDDFYKSNTRLKGSS